MRTPLTNAELVQKRRWPRWPSFSRFSDDLAQVGDPRLRADLGILDIEAVFLLQETDQFQAVDGGQTQVGHDQGVLADLGGIGPGDLGKQVDQGVPGEAACISLRRSLS